MQNDTFLVERVFDGFLCIEDVADFLEGAASCLDEEEVDEYEFEYVPENEEEVVLRVLKD